MVMGSPPSVDAQPLASTDNPDAALRPDTASVGALSLLYLEASLLLMLRNLFAFLCVLFHLSNLKKIYTWTASAHLAQPHQPSKLPAAAGVTTATGAGEGR